MANTGIDLGRYQLGWADQIDYVFTPKKGINEDVVREISWWKGEPQWMTDFRLRSLKYFERKPMLPWFAKNMPDIDFNDIYYYLKPKGEQVDEWDALPEQMKQTYEKLGIPEAERKYLAGVTAQYECLRGDQRVVTTNGYRRIKEIEPGDVVFALNESTNELEPARVMGAKSSGDKEVFELKVRNRTVVASANHPFLVLRDERKEGRQRARYAKRWLPLEEIEPGDFVAVSADIPDYGEPFALLPAVDDRAANFPVVTTPDLLWLMGVFVGDGFIKRSDGYKVIQFAVNKEDQPLIDEIIRVTKELFDLEFSLANDGLRLTAKGTAPLAEFLFMNGISGGALEKKIPDWIFSLPREQRLAFLAGYIDADGTIRNHEKNHDISLTSANQELLEQAKELALLCGITSSRVIAFNSAQPDGSVRVGYRMTFSGRFDRIPCKSKLCAERLGQRKYFHRQNSSHGTTIRKHTSEYLGFTKVLSIESVGMAETFDIEVEGHHNFVAEGFIVHNSEVVYHKNREDLEEQGILFSDMDTALREHPEIVKKYFGTVIPPNDNKFAALNSAVWSGGSFIYIPPGVKCELPLQAYFRINAENAGQFERTLIIADEGSQVHYIEGCSAPVYSSDSLHSAVVELIAHPSSRITYTTIQNWSPNVYNLVTKRARAEAEAHVEWIDGNLGCLAEGTLLTTRSGPKAIEDVIPGDQVLSWNAEKGELCYRTVTARKYSGEQKVREIKTGLRTILATDNHPFFSYTYDETRARKLGRYELAYVRADHLSEAIVPTTSVEFGEPHKLKLPETIVSFTSSNQHVDDFEALREREGRLFVNEATNEDLMWLFGLFLGDGSIERAKGKSGGTRFAKVTFSVPTNDRAHHRLREIAYDIMPGVFPTIRKDEIAISFSCVEFADLLEDNGFASGVHNKRIPEWVKFTPTEQRLALIAGLIDSDGCVTATGDFSIKSVNRELLEDVAQLLTWLGIPGRIHTEFDGEREVVIMGNTATAHGSHRIVFRADERLVAHVSEVLQQRVRERSETKKLKHFRTIGRSSITLPESVEMRKVEVSDHIGTRRTWDIEVEGTANFVANGFIVHNSKLTMKYPAVWLVGPKASGEVLSVAYAGPGQHQDTGSKMVHAAPETTSTIVSKSISKDGGRTSYRGLVRVDPGAHGSKSFVRCDALLLDDISRSDTYPYQEVAEMDASIGHEATVAQVGAEQLFYLMSRGLTEEQAMSMIVNGFIEPITRTLPMEYAVELNRLVEMNMEGSVG